MPRRVCAEPGCPAMIDSKNGSRCEAHTVTGWVRSPSKYQANRLRGAQWLRLRRSVLRRDRYTCWVCGRQADHDGGTPEVDHRIPLSQGGVDSMANLATICQPCHKIKTIAERQQPSKEA